MSITGYVAWVAATIGVWRDAHDWGDVGGFQARAAAVLLLGCFLGAFVLLTTAVPPARRRVKYSALGVLVASTFGTMWLGPSGLSPVLLIIIAVVLATAYRSAVVWAALVVINAAFFGMLVLHWHVDSPWFVTLLYGSFQAFAAITAGARAKAEAVAAELRQVNAGLLATRALLAESARDAERLRVSRELHDVAGHHLTALKLNLDVLGLDASLAARRELVVARQVTAQLLADVRSVVSRLRHDDGLDVSEALRRIAEPFPRPNIHVEVRDGVRVDGAERADALVRACQEALTNAVRHAAAENIWISLTQTGADVALVVRDDGGYSGSHVPGHGLLGMRERVEQVGGSVVTKPAAGGGFEVTVRLAGVAP